MKLFGLLAASASAGIVEHPLFEQFKEWKNQFGKVYSTSAETTERFEKWLDNHQDSEKNIPGFFVFQYKFENIKTNYILS